MNNKFLYLGMLFSFVSIFFIVFLFRYQILQNDRYQKYVENLVVKQNTLRSLRGKIFDRNHDIPLAKNISAYQILFTPSDFPHENLKENVKELSELLSLSEEIIYSKLKKKKKRDTDSYILLDNLLYTEAVHILEKLGNYPGLSWQRKLIRYYPFNDSMAHVVGFVGKIAENESKLLNLGGYTVYDEVGKSGVEKRYENELRGKAGEKQELVNVYGENVQDSKEIITSAIPGNDIILTLDRNMQDIVEKALGNRVGAAIILKPHTGEILSMVSYPRFNPNVFSLVTDKKLISNIQTDSNSPFFNRAIQASTSPASTFKVLLQLAFYQEKQRNWNYTIYDKGFLQIGDRVFYDWYKHGRGWIGPTKALALSNNTFFYTLGIKELGITNIIKYSSMFGLGEKTTVDLPGEIDGILPDPLWKSSRYREPWLDGDTANISIGQGYLTTTLIQLANLTAGIVNEGTIYTPKVLKEIREQISGKVLYSYEPRILHTIDEVSPKVFQQVKRDMREVVVRGTAKVVVTTRAVDIAAKTGTGQIFSDLDTQHFNSMFISFAPYRATAKDQIVLVIWVDAVNEWEWWAPKAANLIYHAIFNKMTYEEAAADLGWKVSNEEEN